MKTVIVKLGGSVLTSKKSDQPRVNKKALRGLTEEIAKAHTQKRQNIVVVHGAGPYGHIPAKKYALKTGLRDSKAAYGVALTRSRMQDLNSEVVGALMGAGVNAIAYQPSASAVMDGGRMQYMDTEPLRGFLKAKIMPVLYGDVVFDRSQGVGILSGDQIVSYLAKNLGAQDVILVTSHDGIFDRDPDDSQAIRYGRVSREHMRKLIGRDTSGTDVTGGIYGKLSELICLSDEGVLCRIISGHVQDNLYKALKGVRGIGTEIGMSNDGS
jgi:isopentenyl phosphate kinase